MRDPSADSATNDGPAAAGRLVRDWIGMSRARDVLGLWLSFKGETACSGMRLGGLGGEQIELQRGCDT